MTALAKQAVFLSAEEYLAEERAAETRSEYANGVMLAMAGGTSNHDLVCGNLYRLIGTALLGRPCQMFTANIKVRIERANNFRYPDVSALCGPVAFHDRVRDAYLNPAFICEVLSPSTATYDLGEKFALYRLIDSFVEYLVVAQDRCWAQLFRRSRAAGWESSEFTDLADEFGLESIGCTLRLREIYDKMDFTPESLSHES